MRETQERDSKGDIFKPQGSIVVSPCVIASGKAAIVSVIEM